MQHFWQHNYSNFGHTNLIDSVLSG